MENEIEIHGEVFVRCKEHSPHIFYSKKLQIILLKKNKMIERRGGVPSYYCACPLCNIEADIHTYILTSPDEEELVENLMSLSTQVEIPEPHLTLVKKEE